MQRRSFLAAGGALLLTLPVTPLGAAPAPGLSLAGAVNRAGRQRMLSQRCAKAWLMVLANVEADKGRKILGDSIALFDRQLAELGTLQPTPEVAAALVQLKSDWDAYKPVLVQAPVAGTAPALFKANEAVLAAAHRLTQAYEKAMGGSLGRIINLAGRQRMLSQRMAKFYLFQRVGVQAAEAAAGLEKARSDFSLAHGELMKAPENNGAVSSELALVEQQWFFFQAALDQAAASPQAASHVATTSERILEQLDLCVGLYEGLAAKAA